MSKFTYQPPVTHVPSFTEYKISGAELAQKYTQLAVTLPFPRSDSWYYHTDEEGWARLLADLAFNSSLYKADRFDCEDYAMKAQSTCAERYGLNTLRYTYGTMPLGAHGFCSFWTGDRFLLFEPNDSFFDTLGGDLVFEVGEHGYTPESVLL